MTRIKSQLTGDLHSLSAWPNVSGSDGPENRTENNFVAFLKVYDVKISQRQTSRNGKVSQSES
jgi:hypothetical protein